MNRRNSLKWLACASAGLWWKTPFPFADTTMQKRKIPSSGELLPVVGVGTWQTFDVGDNAAEREPLEQVLKLLVEKGGSVIDSSPMYGKSERVAGELTEKLGLRKSLFCATKVWTNGKDAGIRQMENSMQLMKARPMDLMQIHNLVDWQTHMPVLRQWKEQGTIRYLGITHYHSGAYRQVEQVMKNEKPDFVQINYSLREREAEERILPLAAEKGIAVLINQPFASGSLFGMVKGKPLPAWASEFDCTSWAQFFLKFILAHPAVTCVIPGTSKPSHLIDNVQAGFGKLPDESQRQKMIAYLKGL